MNKNKIIQIVFLIIILIIIGIMGYMIYTFIGLEDHKQKNFKPNIDNNYNYSNINENISNESNFYNQNEITENGSENKEKMKAKKIKLIINTIKLTATLSDNSTAESFITKLKEGPVTVNMSDYSNFEKVGNLEFSLPRNDQSITTSYGDIILYQGNQITIYYDTNSWNFTKLGKIDNISQNELKRILGNGNVIVTFSID